MDNEELDGVKFSEFPSQTPGNADEVVGLHDGDNARFSVANFILAIRQGLANIFVPLTRTINGKALNNDISLNASDVGAVATSAVGSADGVASLDSNGKVPGTQLDLSGKQDTITASGILKGDGAGGVSAAVTGTDYQAPLTIDATPTANSTNPVQSGGVYTDVRTRVPVYGLGKNLLDNWFFGNPVNQRGESNYSAPGGRNYYTIDRWFVYTAGTSASIGSGFVTIGPRSGGASSIAERLEIPFANVAGKELTISCLLADGSLITASNTLPSTVPSSNTSLISAYGPSGSSGYFARLGYNNGFYFILQAPTNTSLQVVAVKLELGTEQTLAHQENGTWVLNEIPDYEAELIKCQTSTADSSDTYANKSLATEQQLAYVETGTTASRAYAVGEYFCWNGLLYRAKTAISSGGTITPGTNCVQTTLASQIRLSTATLTTNSGGTVSTGLNVSTGKILAAFATGYDISVYLNSSGVQGYFVKTAGTNTPASSVTISVTAVILNY